MKNSIRVALKKFVGDQRGQMLPVMGLMMAGVMAAGGVAVDVSRTMYSYQRLQAMTDAAALAGAQALPTSTAPTVATNYSGVAGSLNASAALPGVTMVSGYPVVRCSTTFAAQGMACTGSLGGNVLQVKEQVTLKMYFLALVGKPSITLTASATAAMRGSTPKPVNVAIIMDTTLSMTEYDSDCGATQMQCALNAVQTLLLSLNPCNTGSATCTITNGQAANSLDRVAMFTFPNVLSSTASIDSGCTTGISSNYAYYNSSYGGYTMMPGSAWSGVPTAWPYSAPTAGASSYSGTSENLVYLSTGSGWNQGNQANNNNNNPIYGNVSGSGYTQTVLNTATVTYQITPFLSDYKTSNSAVVLNPSSSLVKAAGAVLGCGSMLPSNYDGDIGTYYAGAIYAAQAALTAEAAANPGSQNVIILLSDGNADIVQYWDSYNSIATNFTNTGYYPSYIGACGQGITAALAAQAAGTMVYTVAYGSPSTSSSGSGGLGNCSSDVNAGQYPNVTPCQAMAQMASSTQTFFSDYNQSGSGSQCYSAQSVVKLNDIFSSIAVDLTMGRLIPNGTP